MTKIETLKFAQAWYKKLDLSPGSKFLGSFDLFFWRQNDVSIFLQESPIPETDRTIPSSAALVYEEEKQKIHQFMQVRALNLYSVKWFLFEPS